MRQSCRSAAIGFSRDAWRAGSQAAITPAALNASEETVSEQSRHIYRRLRLPDAEIRILLQKTGDGKASKERMHLDLESDDVEAEVARLSDTVQRLCTDDDGV